MEFSLDAQGRRSRLNYFDQAGEPVDCEWGVHEYRWTHPAAGVVIEERSNVAGAPATMRSNLLFHTVRLEFGKDDLLDFVFNIDAQGELVDNAHARRSTASFTTRIRISSAGRSTTRHDAEERQRPEGCDGEYTL